MALKLAFLMFQSGNHIETPCRGLGTCKCFIVKHSGTEIELEKNGGFGITITMLTFVIDLTDSGEHLVGVSIQRGEEW